jgi:hypothetical protein
MINRRKLWIAGGVVGAGLLAFAITGVEVCTDYAYVCENTASMHGYRVWFTGHRTAHWTKTSALEMYMESHWPGVVKHRWTSCAGTGKNILGWSQSFGHGGPGGAMFLSGRILEPWVARHSKEDVRALYDFLVKADKKASEKRADEIIAEVESYQP